MSFNNGHASDNNNIIIARIVDISAAARRNVLEKNVLRALTVSPFGLTLQGRLLQKRW